MGAQKRRNFNFRQSGSERSAEGSYSNYKKQSVKSMKNENIKLANRKVK